MGINMLSYTALPYYESIITVLQKKQQICMHTKHRIDSSVRDDESGNQGGFNLNQVI